VENIKTEINLQSIFHNVCALRYQNGNFKKTWKFPFGAEKT
jgi:hypothetical protein